MHVTAQFREFILIASAILLLIGLFIFDLYTPPALASHALYVVVILIATASRFSWMPPLAAAGSTLLTMVGGLGTPWFADLPRWIQVGNRSITIMILWVLVWFAWKRRQAKTALQRANEDLEQKVAERTQELAAVNRTLVTEIAEHVRTEQALRLSQGRLADILDIAEDAIIVTEDDRSITLFNQGAMKLFGYDPNEVLGNRIDLLLPERFRIDQPFSIGAFADGHESARRTAQRREMFGLKKDGSEFPAEASISKLSIGERTTFTVIVRDITDRLRTERQLQSLTTELMTAQEEERRRIARELHDDVNQRLALLAIDMTNMLSGPSTLTTQAKEAVQSLNQRLVRISDDVRRMAYQFHPSILDDLGLTAALKHMADEWSEKTGIKTVVVQEEMADPLPRDIASCLYRVAQESLSNIMKHARATRVELELTCGDQEITLSIYDTGVGFDLKDIRARHPGLGLVNMRERVRSVRGRLDIRSEPGRGTHIIVHIPFSGAPHETTSFVS
ncbi:MAG: Two-component system sensor histidine kinase [Nitrospira sp.]|jgi:PAS domain S-box-containing protein|nr:MAG: Two-component system sensor histidine kinase [Nitrospira sp.]